MPSFTKLSLAAAIGLSAMTVSGTAHADIIVSRATAPVATGDGNFAWTYNVQLAFGQFDPVSGGNPVQFGTVYDFGPLVTTSGVINNPPVPGSVFIAKSGLLSDAGQFTFSFSGSNTQAGGGVFNLTDKPALTNIRFTYVGTNGIYLTGQPTTLGAGATGIAAGPNNLGSFTVYSPIGTAVTGAYDGQNYKGTNNTLIANSGSLLVPAAAPEPGAWGLMIFGFGMVGAASRRKRRPAAMTA